jgi:hypothetical protein
MLLEIVEVFGGTMMYLTASALTYRVKKDRTDAYRLAAAEQWAVLVGPFYWTFLPLVVFLRVVAGTAEKEEKWLRARFTPSGIVSRRLAISAARTDKARKESREIYINAVKELVEVDPETAIKEGLIRATPVVSREARKKPREEWTSDDYDEHREKNAGLRTYSYGGVSHEWLPTKTVEISRVKYTLNVPSELEDGPSDYLCWFGPSSEEIEVEEDEEEEEEYEEG